MTADELSTASFEDLMRWLKDPHSDSWFEDADNTRMFFARFHDVIDEESKRHVDMMQRWQEEQGEQPRGVEYEASQQLQKDSEP